MQAPEGIPEIQVTFTSTSCSREHQSGLIKEREGYKDNSQDHQLKPPRDNGTASQTQKVNPESPSNSDIIKVLQNMNQSLKGEISGVASKLGQMTSQIAKVENDLQSYENKWESRMEALTGRISQLENDRQSLENRWEMHRKDQSKELSIIQTGIDSNSSAVMELQNKAQLNQEKWDTLLEIEQRIKNAAEQKFKMLQKTITKEIQKEILEEVRSTFAPNTEEIKQGLATLEDKLLREVQSDQSASLSEIKSEIKEVKSNHSEIKSELDEVKSNQVNVLSEIKLDRLKDQAFAKKHNLVVFGLKEQRSPQDDRAALLAFFKERMGLPNLAVTETQRLGQLQMGRDIDRPMMVKFSNIQDRWAAWNRKGSIKKVWDNPVWLQEDLPKKLRENTRIFNRIAKTARQNPDIYWEVRIKDYKLTINGVVYSLDQVHSLPEDLKPSAVYMPRSDRTCVFFTRYSPLSNHHPSNFQIQGQWFVCVEQFLALRRAQLAEDDFLIKDALGKQDPADHKVILNTLRADQPLVWEEKAKEYILQATRAKFEQNEHFFFF